MALPYRWQWRVEKWKTAMRGFFGGEQQQPRPKICPACGALVGIKATRCHECGASLRFSLAALSKKLSGLFGEHEAPVTSALLVTNILMFGVSLVLTMQAGEAGGLRTLWGMSGEASYQLGASHPYGIFTEHQWWRLVMAMFLHGGLIHIGFNMMALMQFGPALEELYGSARYLFLYVVTGALGFLVSAWIGHFSLGASGALLGLVGAMLAVTTKRGGSFMRELRSRLIYSVVILFLIGFWGFCISAIRCPGGGSRGELIQISGPAESCLLILSWMRGAEAARDGKGVVKAGSKNQSRHCNDEDVIQGSHARVRISSGENDGENEQHLAHGCQLSEEARREGAIAGNQNDDDGNDEDEHVAAENKNGEPPGKFFFHCQDDERGGEQQFVGDGIEKSSEGRALIEFARDESIAGVGESGKDEDE